MAKAPRNDTETKTPLKLIYIHLDLGIGGAEQLVLQLAKAGQENGHEVTLITTRCDPDHCFAAVAPGGSLHSNLHIYGNWIPSQIFGACTAIMSTLRILFLTWQVCRHHRDANVCIVDVLPTSLPLLYLMLPSAASFFYCHFPDQLLLQRSGSKSFFNQLYRAILNSLEELTMSTADLMVVNSKFTRDTVLKTFSTFQDDQMNLPVLYPALDLSSSSASKNNDALLPKTTQSPVVSLNRFERKKNVLLLLYAYQYLKETYPDQELPPLIVAGGYDIKNAENVEYRGELQKVVDEKLDISVIFRTDISDDERAALFETALVVVYTPHKEHFGIVPLEAMHAGTPVIAVKSGGPMETIVDNKTGFLREPSPKVFGEALLQLIRDPAKASAMGRAGKFHVDANFGTKRLAREFQALLEECQARQRQTRPRYALWSKVGVYFVDAVYAVVVALLLTSFLQYVGVLKPDESIVGGIKRTLNEGEL